MSMPRLFVGNFDFEHRLGRYPIRQLPRKLAAINIRLLPDLLPLTVPGDFLWVPEPDAIPPEVRERLRQLAGDVGVRLVSGGDVPTGPAIELVPWGWTEEILAWGRASGWRLSAPPIPVVEWANSRQTSHDLEHLWGMEAPGSGCCRNADELKALLRTLPAEASWVLKAEFGMSGRERVLGRGDTLSEPQRNWVEHRFQRGDTLFFEPWLPREAEQSFHYQLDPVDGVTYLGATHLLTDPRGRYLANRPLAEGETPWPESLRGTRRAAEYLASRGYFGPLSIDSMQYRLPEGGWGERPLQDINARWSMGRCVWERAEAAKFS